MANGVLQLTDPPLIFMTCGEEILRLDPEGRIFVRGKQVDDNDKVYAAFRQWLASCSCVDCGRSVLPKLDEDKEK